MTEEPFNCDACKPHRDGKRRAVDSDGDTHVVLCNDAPGRFPVRTYRELDGEGFSFRAHGQSHGRFRLVGYSTRETADRGDSGRMECVRVVEKRS